MKRFFRVWGICAVTAGLLAGPALADDVYNACVVADPNPKGPSADPEVVCKCVTLAVADKPKLKKEVIANARVAPQDRKLSDALRAAIDHCLPK